MLYNDECFKSADLRKFAESMVRKIKWLNSEGGNIDTIISRGSSGCSLASAVLALADFPLYHLFIRHPSAFHTEHGEQNNAGMWGKGNAVIVDDFICSGETISIILNSEPVISRVERLKDREIVGVLICARDGSHEQLPVYSCSI